MPRSSKGKNSQKTGVKKAMNGDFSYYPPYQSQSLESESSPLGQVDKYIRLSTKTPKRSISTSGLFLNLPEYLKQWCAFRRQQKLHLTLPHPRLGQRQLASICIGTQARKPPSMPLRQRTPSSGAHQGVLRDGYKQG